MRICFLTPKYPPDQGGLAISARRITSLLARAGHEIHLCYPDSRLAPGERKQTFEQGVFCHSFGPQRRHDDSQMEWFEWIVELHRQQSFELIHGHYLVGAGFVAVYAARYLGLPSVVSARGNDLERTVFAPEQSGAILWALDKATAVTTVSTDMAAKARALAPNSKVIVVRNSVDTTLFQPGNANVLLREELELKPDAPLIGFVGEARQKKGLSELLLAQAELTALSKATAPALLLIGGVRAREKEILTLFKKQNPTVKVRRIPYVADPQELVTLYNSLDLLVLPSRRDGLPNSLLEGMACGLPIVASAVGGIVDVVENDVSGILLQPRSVPELVAAIRELLPDKAHRQRLGQAAREKAVADHQPQRELGDYLTLYDEIMA